MFIYHIQKVHFSCNLVRGNSRGGTIRSIYLYPVPTLPLHHRKEINVYFMAIDEISGNAAKSLLIRAALSLRRIDNFIFDAFCQIHM